MRFQEPDVAPLSPPRRPRQNDGSIRLSTSLSQQPTTPSRLLPLPAVPSRQVTLSHAPSPVVHALNCSPHTGSSVPRSRSFSHQSFVQRPKISPSRSLPYPRKEIKTVDQRSQSKYVHSSSLYALMYGYTGSVAITPSIPLLLRVHGR